jgi:hypothetical protein
MIIRELMDGIRKLDMVLPEFQREYVWEREQAKQLIVSLYRGYPTGSLLFWKTDKPPDIKNTTIPRDKIGTTLVILDGQQRLTTLYLLTRGEIPPYYREDDIKTDPGNLFFDLESGDFQYYQAMRMKGNATWVAVTECFASSRINPFEVAKQKLLPGQDPFKLAQLYNENLTRLRNVLERDYPIQIVPSSAHIDDAINVFDRVNSLGTKLTDAELALAHITGKWPLARQVMKDKIRELESKRFAFDLTFMVRSLTAVVHSSALFEKIHQTLAPELKTGWDDLTKILNYLVTLLPGQAHIHSTEDLNTTNVLVPVVTYLARHGGRFETDREMRRFVYWMYAASAWSRYTSQTDQRLDHDISITQRSESPWKELVDAIIEQRGRIEVKPSDLEGRIIQHPLYRMTFVMAKAKGAIDWFNGSPLDATHGLSYAIHSHHIFPTSLLYSETGGYNPENHLHKKIVNEIANRAFLTGESNLSLSDTEPARYLQEIEKNYPGALAKQFVPQDPALWNLDRFNDFLAARRRLIADAINERMAELLADLEPTKAQTLEEMMTAGESPVLEFKSSLRWDLRTQQTNSDLQKVVAKTVAGLMNFEGGTLLIGVADDGTVIGIENDLRTLKRDNCDGFEQALREVLVHYLGAEFSQYVHVSFEEHGGHAVCLVRVEPSPKPVYLADKGGKEFYIRAGNTTRPLDVQATHDYISMHWEM